MRIPRRCKGRLLSDCGVLAWRGAVTGDLAQKLNVISKERRLHELQMLPAHLATARQEKRLWKVMWSIDVLPAKLEATNVTTHLTDFDLLPDDVALRESGRSRHCRRGFRIARAFKQGILSVRICSVRTQI